jgi:hypothetical protein
MDGFAKGRFRAPAMPDDAQIAVRFGQGSGSSATALPRGSVSRSYRSGSLQDLHGFPMLP